MTYCLNVLLTQIVCLLPDVDIDYADDRQNEMFKYAAVRYGAEYVARIGTYGTLGAKDAIKRVGKALDIGNDWEDSEQIKSGWKSGYKTLQIVNDMTKSIDEKVGTSLSEILASNQDIKRYAQEFPFSCLKQHCVWKELLHLRGACSRCCFM